MPDFLTASPAELLQDPRQALLFFLFLIWPIPWKGVALWRAAHHKRMGWFIAIFLLNTAAVLEIVYLAYFQKGKRKEDENSS